MTGSGHCLRTEQGRAPNAAIRDFSGMTSVHGPYMSPHVIRPLVQVQISALSCTAQGLRATFLPLLLLHCGAMPHPFFRGQAEAAQPAQPLVLTAGFDCRRSASATDISSRHTICKEVGISSSPTCGCAPECGGQDPRRGHAAGGLAAGLGRSKKVAAGRAMSCSDFDRLQTRGAHTGLRVAGA